MKKKRKQTMHRLRPVAAGLGGSAPSAAHAGGLRAADTEPDTEPAAPTPAPTPLSSEALAEFVRTGVCLVRPSELAPEWHAAISGKTRAFVQREEGSVPSKTWPQSAVAKSVKELVGDDVDTVLRSASVRGALQSILGKDFVLEPGMAMHLTNGIDQTWVSAAALCVFFPP